MPLIIESKYSGSCNVCGEPYAAGDKVDWKKGRRGARCVDCHAKGALPPAGSAAAAKPLRDNQSRPVDVHARTIPDRAWRVARLVEKGETDAARDEALQVALDLNLCLKDGDYALGPPRRAGDEE